MVKKKQLAVCGPMGEPVLCEYGVLPDGTAVAEMADCAGLTLVGRNKDPLRATTFGVGQLLQHSLGQRSQKSFCLVLGAAPNDLGLGMAEALGFRFWTKMVRRLCLCLSIFPKSIKLKCQSRN